MFNSYVKLPEGRFMALGLPHDMIFSSRIHNEAPHNCGVSLCFSATLIIPILGMMGNKAQD